MIKCTHPKPKSEHYAVTEMKAITAAMEAGKIVAYMADKDVVADGFFHYKISIVYREV